MTAQLPNLPIELPSDVSTEATQGDTDVKSVETMTVTVLPPGHPHRPDAAEMRRLTWRRQSNVRTTYFRRRQRAQELRS